MRAAFALHLFYEEVALELLEQLLRLDQPIDVIATVAEAPSRKVRRALARFKSNVQVLETPNRGRDVGPLLHVLPLLQQQGYDVFCKLHTKRGNSGYASEWREALFGALAGSQMTVDKILSAFRDRKKLGIVGPKSLFLSVSRHLPANRDDILRLARLCFPGDDLPRDWGFFAGTMFWGRTASFLPFTSLAKFGVELEADNTRTDGQTAHALERVFGLAGVVKGAEVGLCETGGSGLRFPDSTEELPIDTLQSRLLALKRNSIDEATGRSADEAVGRENPLVHYIEEGARTGFDPNPYFHTSWYLAAHPEVAERGINPLAHFIGEGAKAGASPSPLFDTGHYYRRHPHLFHASINPLQHFLETARSSGDQPRRLEVSSGIDEGWGRHVARHRTFDAARQQAFFARLDTLPPRIRRAARRILVSVIVPVLDQAEQLDRTVESVLSQTSQNLELIIVDMRRSKETPRRTRRHARDPRIRVIAARDIGVAGARNRALKSCRGGLVAYLDPGNSWTSEFLDVMTRFMEATGCASAYCISEFKSGNAILAYQGDQFDWNAAVEEDTIPLNAFCHRRELYLARGGFDESLRLAEWEFVLRLIKAKKVGFAPFVGCEYRGVPALDRLSRAPLPCVHATAVKARSNFDLGGGPAASPAAQNVSLSIGIKVTVRRGAAYKDPVQWGDYQFADALRRALEGLGHSAFVDLPEDWYAPRPRPDDVVITIRGLDRYEPQPEQINVLWNISHPEDVSYEEYESYDIAYVASQSYAAFLRTILGSRARPLLQATAPDRFHPIAAAERVPHQILFVGNTRGEYREIVRWAIEEGFKPAIYGSGWGEFVAGELVKGDHLQNSDLARHYAGARRVLNDHFPAMRDFGFVSNRVYDVIASGGTLISDFVPTIGRIFGEHVVMVRDRTELRRALETRRDGNADAAVRTKLARLVTARDSFDERAKVIVEDVFEATGSAWRPKGDAGVKSRRRTPSANRIHLIVRGKQDSVPDESAFVRLIAPLTDDVAGFELSFGGMHDLTRVDGADLCIVQAGSLPDPGQCRALIDRLRIRATPLIVDLDGRGPLAGTPQPLLRIASQIWVADNSLRQQCGGLNANVHVVPCGIDVRIWKDYGGPSTDGRPNQPLRLLYVNRPANPEGCDIVLGGLELAEKANPGSFNLTFIGDVADLAERSWLRQLNPPPSANSYPRFARWLRLQGPFDVGLIGADGSGAQMADAHFLEYSALGLLSVLSDPKTCGGEATAKGLAVIGGNTPKGWRDALRHLPAKIRSTPSMANAARAYAFENRSASHIARQQTVLIKSALEARTTNTARGRRNRAAPS